jgi:hypothetical protein
MSKKVFTDQLRDAIQRSDKSRYRLWKETGIDQAGLCRFVAGTAGLSLESVDRLCSALALDLVPHKTHERKATDERRNHGSRSKIC